MNLIANSASYLPSAIRSDAVEIAYLSAAGWGANEIGQRLGISGRRVNVIRTHHAGAVVESLRDDGYADTEIIRLLGVPTSAVTANGAGRKSGSNGAPS